jgi:hypothetical protein
MAIGDKNTVGTTFWLNLAAERVYGSLEKATFASEKLKATIVWIFGVYSSITFAGLVMAKKEDWSPWAICLIGIAFILLILSYFESNRATFPLQTELLPTIEEDIKQANAMAVRNAYRHLKTGLKLCSFGVGLYCFALLVQFSGPLRGRYVEGDRQELRCRSVQKIMGCDSLVLKYLFDERSAVLHVNVFSKPNSWVKVRLEHDTVIKDLLVSLPVYPADNLMNHQQWLYVDSSMSATINIAVPKLKQLFLSIERKDTVGKDITFKTSQLRVKLP